MGGRAALQGRDKVFKTNFLAPAAARSEAEREYNQYR
jgi:hypothetical protein